MSGRTFTYQGNFDDFVRYLVPDVEMSDRRKSVGIGDSMLREVEEFLNRFVVTAVNDAGDIIFDAAGTYTFQGDVIIDKSLTAGTNAWHVDADGNMWWGSASEYTGADNYITSAGVLRFGESGGTHMKTFTGTDRFGFEFFPSSTTDFPYEGEIAVYGTNIGVGGEQWRIGVSSPQGATNTDTASLDLYTESQDGTTYPAKATLMVSSAFTTKGLEVTSAATTLTSFGDIALQPASGSNVGINRGNPDTPLHVNGAVTISSDTGVGNSHFPFTDGRFYYTADPETGGTGDHVFRHYSGGSYVEQMRILENGNVGINNPAPLYTLDVGGTIRSTSVIRIDSTTDQQLILHATATNDRPYMSIFHHNDSTYRRAGYVGYPEHNASGAHMQMVADLGWVNFWAGGYGAGLRVGLPTGSYGTVETSGNGKGGWEGYSINGQQVFMGNGTETCGIYNDVDNQWLLLFDADTYTRLYDSDGIVAFGANDYTSGGTGSAGNGYVGVSNYCGGFSGTTAVMSTQTVAGVTMKRLGFSTSSYEFKSGIKDLAMSDEAFMSLRPITFHPNGQYVDSTGELTEIVGGHTIVPDNTEAGETDGLMPLRRAGFGLEDLYGRDDTMILASEFSPDPMAMIALLTQKLQETMTRVAALEA